MKLDIKSKKLVENKTTITIDNPYSKAKRINNSSQKNFRILIFFLLLVMLKSFSSSTDSVLKSVFVSSVNLKNLKSNTENKGKLESKGDILEFCEREQVPLAIHSIGIKVKKSSREKQDPVQPVAQTTIINNHTIYFYDLLSCLLILYLILFLLSYLKWYEEMFLVILDYINRGYFDFKDLTDPKTIKALENEPRNEKDEGELDNLISFKFLFLNYHKWYCVTFN